MTQLASPSGLLPALPGFPRKRKGWRGRRAHLGGQSQPWDSLRLVFLSSSFTLPPPPPHPAARVSLLCLKPPCLIKRPHRISEAVHAWGPLTTPPGPSFYSVAASWAPQLVFSLPLSGTFLLQVSAWLPFSVHSGLHSVRSQTTLTPHSPNTLLIPLLLSVLNYLKK